MNLQSNLKQEQTVLRDGGKVGLAGKLFVASALFLAASPALLAADSVVFVHGRSGSHCDTSNGYSSDINNYWGTAKSINTALPKYFVGYDGASDPRTTGTCRAQSKIKQIFDAKCTGANSCYVICHSAGCYAAEYFIDKSTATYNIKRIWASSSAAGGSELANAAFWASNDMVSALKTGNARGSYNHNNMRGVTVYSLGGSDGGWTGAAIILPGEDDGAVSFHSTCAINTTGSYSNCLSAARYSSHSVWAGGASGADWKSAQNGYYQGHTGDGSNSINTSMKLEWNRCKALGSGCN